jgi:uncharacterized protein (UPF0335 family)
MRTLRLRGTKRLGVDSLVGIAARIAASNDSATRLNAVARPAPLSHHYCEKPVPTFSRDALEPSAQPNLMEFQLAEESIAADELRLLIERIERLEEEKKGISDDIKDVYGEAKSRGYDPKTMRTVVRLRKMENHVRQEAEALLDTYKAALGLG